MIHGNKYLYKRSYQEPVEDEIPKYKGKSKTSTISHSKKRSSHKHVYKKIILHYGSDSFCWGRQCEICGRLDSTYKASYIDKEAFKIIDNNLYGNWEEICLTQIHNRYPEYTIMTLKNAKWIEWTKNRKV